MGFHIIFSSWALVFILRLRFFIFPFVILLYCLLLGVLGRNKYLIPPTCLATMFHYNVHATCCFKNSHLEKTICNLFTFAVAILPMMALPGGDPYDQETFPLLHFRFQLVVIILKQNPPKMKNRRKNIWEHISFL